jgi:hypothetical protein
MDLSLLLPRGFPTEPDAPGRRLQLVCQLPFDPLPPIAGTLSQKSISRRVPLVACTGLTLRSEIIRDSLGAPNSLPERGLASSDFRAAGRETP